MLDPVHVKAECYWAPYQAACDVTITAASRCEEVLLVQ